MKLLPEKPSHRHSLFAGAWAALAVALDLQPHPLSWVSGAALLAAIVGHALLAHRHAGKGE